MKTYYVRYCLVTEDGALQVAEIAAQDFIDAAKMAVARTPMLMKVYSLEEAPGQPVTPPKRLIHLDECMDGVDRHTDLPECHVTTYAKASSDGTAELCPQTAYMSNDLFPDENVWLEDKR